MSKATDAPFHMGLDVVEIGVREGLLLAGHLCGGGLLEQRDRTIGAPVEADRKVVGMDEVVQLPRVAVQRRGDLGAPLRTERPGTGGQR